MSYTWRMVFPGRSDVTLAKMNNPLFVSEDRVEVEQPRLRIVVERERGAEVHREIVHDGDLLRVGSHASNDLVLDDPTISRFHCRITREQGAWRITDTDSKNGTRVGGVRVLSAVIEGEATLAIGDSLLRVREGGPGEGVSAPAEPSFGGLLGGSAPMRRLFAMLERLAAVGIDVLVLGESGTGKELIASELVQRQRQEQRSARRRRLRRDLPALVESELFGHVRGAFTGADRDREGVRTADGGTVFSTRSASCRSTSSRTAPRARGQEVRRVGQTKAKRVDVRVIAATHRDLEREVNGRFRETSTTGSPRSPCASPAPRRLEDVPALVRLRGPAGGRERQRLFNRAAMEELCRYDWPGIRELGTTWSAASRSTRRRRVAQERRHAGVPRDVRRTRAPGDAQRRRARTGAGRPGRHARTVPPSAGASAGDGAPGHGLAAPEDRSVPFRVAKERAIEAFEKAYLAPLLEECAGNEQGRAPGPDGPDVPPPARAEARLPHRPRPRQLSVEGRRAGFGAPARSAVTTTTTTTTARAGRRTRAPSRAAPPSAR